MPSLFGPLVLASFLGRVDVYVPPRYGPLVSAFATASPALLRHVLAMGLAPIPAPVLLCRAARLTWSDWSWLRGGGG